MGRSAGWRAVGALGIALLVVALGIIGAPTKPVAADLLPVPGLWTPPGAALPPTTTYVYMDEPISIDPSYGTRTRVYTPQNTQLTVTLSPDESALQVRIVGYEDWTGGISLLGGQALHDGVYTTSAPVDYTQPPSTPQVGWLSSTLGGCGAGNGWFAVDDLVVTGGKLEHAAVRFEMTCPGGGPVPTHVALAWDASTAVPTPTNPRPAPADLWTPPTGALPATGNGLYLETPAAAGTPYATWHVSAVDAAISVSNTGPEIHLSALGDADWGADLAGPDSLAQLPLGYYGDLLWYPYRLPKDGGVESTFLWESTPWQHGDVDASMNSTGWFAIDDIAYAGSAITRLTIRFELRDFRGNLVHRGVMRWDSAAPVVPPPNPSVIPTGLWAPPAGFVPADRTSVGIYQANQASGQVSLATYQFTPANAVIGLTSNGDAITVSVDGDTHWTLSFSGPAGSPQLQQGLYSDLHWLDNPRRGTMLTAGLPPSVQQPGWFAVDDVAYSASGALQRIALRFYYPSEGVGFAGEIKWDVDTPAYPSPNPTFPVSAPYKFSAALPTSGNYLHEETTPDAPADRQFSLTATDSDVSFYVLPTYIQMTSWPRISDNPSPLYLTVTAPLRLPALEPGHYADVRRLPYNPLMGALDAVGDADDGSTVATMDVDEATMVDGRLHALTLRFEIPAAGYKVEGILHWVSPTADGSPNAPTNLVASPVPPPRTANNMLWWTPPSASGDGPITGYVLTPYRDGVAQPVVAIQGNTHGMSLDGIIQPGADYTFTLQAINAAGPGLISAPSAPVHLGSDGFIVTATTTSTTTTTTTTPPSTTTTSTVPPSTTTTTTTTPPVACDANCKFVRATFTDFLGRTPTTQESTYLDGLLDAGTLTPSGLVSWAANSPAWANHIVDRMYRDTLGRPPDAGGLAYWSNLLATHENTVAQVATSFYSSDEYYSTFGRNDPTAWVTDLYQKLLHRAPDAAGLQSWVAVEQTQGRAVVAAQIYGSVESRSDRVAGLYEQLLGRAPDAAGLAYWTGALATTDDITLAASLAASPEYFSRAQTR